MAIFDEEQEGTFFCVGWCLSGEFDEATWRYFDNRKECIDFADEKSKKSSANVYMWMAERGTYINQAGNPVSDWMYWWWSNAAQIESGPRPQTGCGVPDSRAWDYHTEYKSLSAPT